MFRFKTKKLMLDTKINLAGDANQENKLPLTVPVAPTPPVSGAVGMNTASEGSFQNIFTQKNTKPDEAKVLETAISNKDAVSKLKPILGNAPALQRTLQQEKEYSLKKKLRSIQTLFVIILLIGLGASGYFYSQLSPHFTFFGQNTVTQLDEVNKSLKGLQTQLNKYRYLAAQIDLNRFSYVSNEFLDKTSQYNNPNVASNVKTQLAADIQEAQTDLPQILVRLKENLGQNIVISTYHTGSEEESSDAAIQAAFEADLKSALRGDLTQLTKNKTSDDPSEDVKLINNTLKLVGNEKLLNTLKNLAVERFTQDLEEYKTTQDPTKRKALQTTIATLLSSTQSDISTIGAIKSTRTEWSKIIKQLETVTKEVDPYFGTGVYEAVGFEIVYTGYEFDSTSQKIVLSGLTKTNDAKNFTLITKLIDALEGSAFFKDVDMRSFTKSGTLETGFVANFKLALHLEDGETSTKDKPVSLFKGLLREKAGFRRIKN